MVFSRYGSLGPADCEGIAAQLIVGEGPANCEGANIHDNGTAPPRAVEFRELNSRANWAAAQ